jgi:transposase-like protein
MNNCPWCGKQLEVRSLDAGKVIRYVCGRCGFKLKEFPKPEQPKPEVKQPVVEIRQEEMPVAKSMPAWPFILGAAIVIIVIVTLVKVLLV